MESVISLARLSVAQSRQIHSLVRLDFVVEPPHGKLYNMSKQFLSQLAEDSRRTGDTPAGKDGK
jgi:hypothetical protein